MHRVENASLHGMAVHIIVLVKPDGVARNLTNEVRDACVLDSSSSKRMSALPIRIPSGSLHITRSMRGRNSMTD